MTQKRLLEEYIECLQNSNKDNIRLNPATTKPKKPPEAKKEYKRKYYGKKELAISKTRKRMGRIRPAFVELISELERAILCHRPEDIKSFSAEYLESKLTRRALLEGAYDEDYDPSVCYEAEEEEEEEEFERQEREFVKPCITVSFGPELRSYFIDKGIKLGGECLSDVDVAMSMMEESKIDAPPSHEFIVPCASGGDEAMSVQDESKIDSPPIDVCHTGYEDGTETEIDRVSPVMELSTIDPPPIDLYHPGYGPTGDLQPKDIYDPGCEEAGDRASPAQELSTIDPPPIDLYHPGYSPIGIIIKTSSAQKIELAEADLPTKDIYDPGCEEAGDRASPVLELSTIDPPPIDLYHPGYEKEKSESGKSNKTPTPARHSPIGVDEDNIKTFTPRSEPDLPSKDLGHKRGSVKSPTSPTIFKKNVQKTSSKSRTEWSTTDSPPKDIYDLSYGKVVRESGKSPNSAMNFKDIKKASARSKGEWSAADTPPIDIYHTGY